MTGILASKYSCCMQVQISVRPGALGTRPRAVAEAAKEACNNLAGGWRLQQGCRTGLSKEGDERQPRQSIRGTNFARAVSLGGAAARHSAVCQSLE